MYYGCNEESELYLKNDVKAFVWAAKFFKIFLILVRLDLDFL